MDVVRSGRTRVHDDTSNRGASPIWREFEALPCVNDGRGRGCVVVSLFIDTHRVVGVQDEAARKDEERRPRRHRARGRDTHAIWDWADADVGVDEAAVGADEADDLARIEPAGRRREPLDAMQNDEQKQRHAAAMSAYHDASGSKRRAMDERVRCKEM